MSLKHLYLLCPGVWQRYRRARYSRIVRQTNELASRFAARSDNELAADLHALRNNAQANATIEPLLPQALALCRELSHRTLGMRHYDVQLLGSLALFDGYIAEMDTGEGKTLMAPVAALLHHLAGLDRCVHIVTANEYLAARDAQWMGPLYEALGLSVGLIVPGQPEGDRIRAYQQAVVYATAKEVVFDSLREPARLRGTSPVEAILRPRIEHRINPVFDFAIVDEVDSVLIDQAGSPLSIGSASAVSPQLQVYQRAGQVAGQLIRGIHYRLLHDDRKVELKDEGRAEARRRASGVLRLIPPGQRWDQYVTCALAARYLYKKDQHYVVRAGKVVLIDESTGRMLPGRQLPDGLHQAVEVANGIMPSAELRGDSQTTFQTFFRQYKKLAGMTGTASTATREFMSVYRLAVLPIPPNRPSRRQIRPDEVYRSTKRKAHAVLERIQAVHATGRPLLIATGTVKASEQLSKLLAAANFQHEVLNAKNHAREAEIIAQAGKPGRITIITNMAGRGVDIKLGDGVAELGGLYLLGTDRLALRRLDDQLAGRVGRQGDPGDVQFMVSLKDDLMRQAAKKKIVRLRQASREQRTQPIASPAAAQLVADVQKHIAKVTSAHRRRVCKAEKQREDLKAKGLWEDWMNLR